MHKSQLRLLNCKKPNILSRRDSRNATAQEQAHSHTSERAKSHKDAKIHNSTESDSHSSKNESFPQKTSAEKNYTEHIQASSVKHDEQTDSGDHSKQQSPGNSTSDYTPKDTDSGGATLDYSAWNSTSPPPSNSSDTSAKSPSRVKEFFHSNQTVSNDPGNSTLISNSSSFHFPAAISSTNSSFNNFPSISSTNSSSPEQLQPPTADQHQGDHHYKIKVWCIGMGSLIALICVGTAMVLAKKRLTLRGTAAFLRRRFRSHSNDSNRAVRDRSSLGPQFRTSDPFSSPSSISRKPLVLRPDSLSYIHSSSPRRPSLLHLRNQSLKSQISPPIIEPPSPVDNRPFSVGSPDKAIRYSSYNQPPSQFTASPPSYHQPRDYPMFLSNHPTSLPSTCNPGTRRGSSFPTKVSEIASRLGEENSDPLTERTPVPPRPPRPDYSLLPSSRVRTGVLSEPVRETEPVFPTILPLKVTRRPQSTHKHNRRHNSIDQVILDPLATLAFQDSPTLPQFHRDERNSVLSTARGADPGRGSHLSRSTCYSQSSEQEGHPILGECTNPDPDNHSTLRFMSFGTSRNSAKLQQQLDSFISSNLQNDTHLH